MSIRLSFLLPQRRNVTPASFFYHPSEGMSSLDPFPFSHLPPQPPISHPSLIFCHPSLFFCHPSESWDLPATVEAAIKYLLLLTCKPPRRKSASRPRSPFHAIDSISLIQPWATLFEVPPNPGKSAQSCTFPEKQTHSLSRLSRI
jgi:hypothetical protein